MGERTLNKGVNGVKGHLNVIRLEVTGYSLLIQNLTWGERSLVDLFCLGLATVRIEI